MSETRAIPYYCPFCGEETLRPSEEGHGVWECRSCTRVFSTKLIGLRPVDLTSSGSTGPAPTEGPVL